MLAHRFTMLALASVLDTLIAGGQLDALRFCNSTVAACCRVFTYVKAPMTASAVTTESSGEVEGHVLTIPLRYRAKSKAITCFPWLGQSAGIGSTWRGCHEHRPIQRLHGCKPRP